jgi:hypothetical protein
MKVNEFVHMSKCEVKRAHPSISGVMVGTHGSVERDGVPLKYNGDRIVKYAWGKKEDVRWLIFDTFIKVLPREHFIILNRDGNEDNNRLDNLLLLDKRREETSQFMAERNKAIRVFSKLKTKTGGKIGRFIKKSKRTFKAA